MKHLIIVGVGGFAREVYWHAQDSLGYGTEWDLKGFLDGDVRLADEEYEKLELPVLGDVDNYELQEDDVFVCAIGTHKVRKQIVEKVQKKNAEFISLIHRSAIVHGNVQIGKGVIISPMSNIHDHAKIGDFTIVNVCSGIGHDACIGEFVDIMGEVCITGNVRIEDEVFLAEGVAIMPHGYIEKGAHVGPRSLVLRHVKRDTKVFGIPAMPI